VQHDGLLRQLCLGVLRWRWRLEFWREQLVTKPLRVRDADVAILLLMGLFQLAFLNMPVALAIDSTVGAAKRRKPWASGLLNACLRTFVAQRDRFQTQRNMQAHYSHPQWLLQQLRADWPGHWSSIAEANNIPAPLSLRVNRQRTNRAALLEQFARHDVTAQAGLSAEAIFVKSTRKVVDLPGFEQGLFSVQDQSAQWAAHLLAARPGDRVLDACAAPGGKAGHILELQTDLSAMLLLERDRRRSLRIEQNLSRLGLKATLKIADACAPDDWWDGLRFDRILLDAPCSGTGIIRRHPDIKSLRRPQDIEQHAVQQRRLLNTLWPLLKPGGRLLYATCSIMARENGVQVQEFLQANADARCNTADLPGALPCALPGKQLVPCSNGGDGFYYALLDKHPH